MFGLTWFLRIKFKLKYLFKSASKVKCCGTAFKCGGRCKKRKKETKKQAKDEPQVQDGPDDESVSINDVFKQFLEQNVDIEFMEVGEDGLPKPSKRSRVEYVDDDNYL